jgi:hypothetical protein
VSGQEETGFYAALSYCWGGAQPVQTTAATINAMMNGIKCETFPKTLQDAIEATRKLQLRYLWVDSLCIIQDDPADVAKEITMMPQVYKEAYVTISAECAKTCRDGFLHERPPPMSAYWSFKLPFRCPDGQLGHVILENRQPANASNAPIHARAWTLQETLLSPRFVGYGERGIEWRCPSYRITDEMVEADTDDYHFLKGKHTIPSEHHYLSCRDRIGFEETRSTKEAGIDSVRTWHDIVEVYTARKLTVPSDKLPAIAAVAQELAPSICSEYLGGLWSGVVGYELLWKVEEPLPRPATWRAPTWSWASVDSIVEYLPISTEDAQDPVVELVANEIQPLDEFAPFGQLKHASITIKARVKQASWTTDGTALRDHSTEAYTSKLPMNLVMDAQEVPGDDVLCVEILPWKPGFRPEVTGLILTPTNTADKFRRVGYFELSMFPEPEYDCGHGPQDGLLCKILHRKPVTELPEWFADSQARIITII